ncbi:PIN domain-containing protein [Bradyrhizobium erythrophlei]|nr:PIN domain-containing protein [Bradyrhizobium erythrophlei]
MHYDAITFDTQTVETNSFHFDGGLLAQLKQFKGGPVRVVVSEIVVREIFKHLVEKTRAARDGAAAAHKKAVDHGLASQNMPFVADSVDIWAVARSRLEKFLRDIGAEIVRATNVPVGDLVDAYFQPSAPFSAAGKNKAEFPDAIALFSLARWASEKNLKILAASQDKGWKAYAALHDWIDLRGELADALSVLQKHAEDARAVVQVLLRSIDENAVPELTRKFEFLLATALSGYDVLGSAESFYEIESDHVELELEELWFVGDEDSYEFSLIQSGPNILAAEVDLEVRVKAETSFYMSIYDSIDKDSTSAGSVTAQTDKEFELKVLITVERDEPSSQFEMSKLEILKGPRTIDFGFVEPDYEPEPEENYEIPDDLPAVGNDEVPW